MLSLEQTAILENATGLSSGDLIQLQLDYRASNTEPLLLQALLKDDLALVSHLLCSGERVTNQVIQTAAETGKWKIFEVLQDFAEDDIKENSQGELLIAAIRPGKKDLIHTLFACGIKILCPNHLNKAILAAVEVGDISALRLLLNDDPTYRASALGHLRNSLHYAIARGQNEITEILLTAGETPNALCDRADEMPLLRAIRKKDVDLSKRLLAAGAAVDMTGTRRDEFTSSLLPEAVAWGHREIILDIIRAGADINAPRFGTCKTALTAAVEKGDLATVKFLIHAGADVNAFTASQFGYSALRAAVSNNDTNMARYLLNLGADVNEQSLIVALDKSVQMMQLLLTARLERYKRFSMTFGCRTLQHAIASSNAVMMEVLLSNGIDPNTILGQDEIQNVSIFAFHHVPNVGTQYPEGLNRSNDLWMIQMLLRSGANLNKAVSEKYENCTALSAAIISEKSLALIKTLIAAGADVNAKPFWGILHTPLQLATREGDIDVVEINSWGMVLM